MMLNYFIFKVFIVKDKESASKKAACPQKYVGVRLFVLNI